MRNILERQLHLPISQCTKQLSYRVGITGHQVLGNEETVRFVHQSMRRILVQLKSEHPAEEIIALSGLAAGADTIFAEIALTEGMALEVCLASTDIIDNFPPGPERIRFLMLQGKSRQVYRLNYAKRSNEAYLAMGHWVVDSCNVIIAVWNGLPAVATGGTGDVVVYAQEQKRPIIHIHTVEHTIQIL